MTKKQMSKTIITWLLIASPLWWTYGCYSFQETTNLIEANENGRDIEVTTNGNNTYIFEFKKWTLDTEGTIWGQTKWDDSSYTPPWSSHPSKYIEGNFSVPKDSIKSVAAKKPNAGLILSLVFIPVALIFYLTLRPGGMNTF
jgi:hypothetical protein